MLRTFLSIVVLLLAFEGLVVPTSSSDASSLVVRRAAPDWTRELLDGSSTQVTDAKCNLASVRRANSQQLHGILSDLLNTTYFRLFRVNVDGACPMEKKDSSATVRPSTDAVRFDVVSGSGGEDVEEEEECTGLGSAPLFGEPEGASSCDVSTSELGGSSVEEEECESDLCNPMSWIDHTTTKEEEEVLDKQKADDTNCDDENSPNFWLNICEKLPTQPLEYVNLQLNEERHTGYNGSKIWEAIYTENCFKGSAPEDMCYEERVMYRLLSGLHASINTHISLYFHIPKSVGDPWLPNPKRFMKVLGNHPDRINNLHFAFVVLLRALRKATPILRTESFDLGDKIEASRTQALMEHLLDSYVLTSCNDVFEAFDESLLFQGDGHPSSLSSMKREFKAVFHNISDIFNCVKCRRCRLHGKMQLLGVGTALKILLLPEELITLSKDETVAFVNTIGKFSESLTAIPKLVQEYYWEINEREQAKLDLETAADTVQDPLPDRFETQQKGGQSLSLSSKERALAAVSEAVRKQLVPVTVEDALVDAALEHEDMALIAQYFSHDLSSFVRHATRRFAAAEVQNQKIDVVVVGGGLSGTTAALTLLDRGARVALIEKEGFIGGNSARASSGINGIDENSTRYNDTVEIYTTDILNGGGQNSELAGTLAKGSVQALEWLRTRLGIPLEEISRLGGHSNPRTHRPSTGLAGAELISAVNKHLRPYIDTKQLKVYTRTKVVRLINNKGKVEGVVCRGDETFEVRASHTVLATGGYAYDTAPAGLLSRYRADLQRFGTTNGRFATGDGIKMAHDSSLKARVVDMDSIQLHPTGFVDVNNRNATEKKLCAEMLRGVGGILLNQQGKRFANELGTRSYLTQRMLESSQGVDQPEFNLLLNRAAASKAKVHIPMYSKRKLLFAFATLEEAAQWMNVSASILKQTLEDYDALTSDSFGKTVFPSTPFVDDGPYYVGKVTPVLHYCMGGLEISKKGEVLRESDSSPIPGLYAAGEVVGGIHGSNRLGGNALTECVVFGRIVGEGVPLEAGRVDGPRSRFSNAEAQSIEHLPTVTAQELAAHNSETDCWVSLYSQVFDLTAFVEVHPAGPESIIDLCGQDGTKTFKEIHSQELLSDFEVIGKAAKLP